MFWENYWRVAWEVMYYSMISEKMVSGKRIDRRLSARVGDCWGWKTTVVFVSSSFWMS